MTIIKLENNTPQLIIDMIEAPYDIYVEIISATMHRQFPQTKYCVGMLTDAEEESTLIRICGDLIKDMYSELVYNNNNNNNNLFAITILGCLVFIN